MSVLPQPSMRTMMPVTAKPLFAFQQDMREHSYLCARIECRTEPLYTLPALSVATDHSSTISLHCGDVCHDPGYNSGTFYDPQSPSLGAWLELLPADIKAEGLGVGRLKQNNTHRVPGFITQGPKPTPSLDEFRASVMKPPQPAVKYTHRFPLSQQAPKVTNHPLDPSPQIGSFSDC